MRIDGPNPIPPAVAQPVARDAQKHPAPEAKTPVVKDHVEVQPQHVVSPTNVLVEMQPGNIVVYKFVDESSGKVIQQIPSEQMLNLSEAVESNEKSKKQK
jgi:FlaG protein